MAAVTITYRWADDDALSVTVEVDESYPDAIDEARAGAVRAYREAIGASVEALAALDADKDDDDNR